MDIYETPMLSIRDAARYLQMSPSTLATWRRDETIHSVQPHHRGWPTLPFAAVVEAYVLRALRQTHFPMKKIKAAAEGVRKAFHDDYGLVRPNIVYDAAEIFIQIGGEMYKAENHQQAIRETVQDFKDVIAWSGKDPQRIRLQQFDGAVILDPRFGWGSPVVASNKVSVEAIMGMFRGRETIEAIAENYEMNPADVERIIQSYVAADAA